MDTGVGLACTVACEVQVKRLQAMIERTQKVYVFGARTHTRNAIWLFVLAVFMLTFGWIGDRNAYLIGVGLVMLLGSVFSWLNSRRLTKLNAEVRRG